MQETLTERSYRHIREKLTHGDLAPGERLVTRTLASEIGVSLAPVREALHRLASEGIVEHVPGAGAFVRDVDRNYLEELYVLREAVESRAAGEAARYITEHQLEDLQAIVDDWLDIAATMRKTPAKHATRSILSRWLDNEEQFHELLIAASKNRLLVKVTREYRAISQVFEVQRPNPSILTLEVVERTCRDRLALMKALRKREAERCEKLMSDQIKIGRKTVMAFLRKTKAVKQ